MTTAGQRSNEGHGQARDPIPLFGLLPGSLPSGEVDRLLGDVAAAEDAYQQPGRRGVGPHGRAVGLDLDPGALAIARQAAQRTGVAASFVCADATTPVTRQAFDLAYARRSGQITSRLVRRVKASQPGSTGSQNVATR